MKTILSLALASVVLTACGTAPQAASNVADAQEQQARTQIFSRDDRPVDGDFNEVKFVPAADGTYTATFHKEFGGLRPTPTPAPETRQLGSGLACTFGESEVLCRRDNRPVDGALVEVKLVKNAAQEWDATLRRVVADRINQQWVDTTENVATGLRQAPAVRIYGRDLRPVDGALIELKMVQDADGTYTLSLRKAGRLSDETTVISSSMTCAFDFGVICERDDRPVDGIYTSVYLTETARGVFTATQTASWYNRVEGHAEQTSEVIAESLRQQR